MSGYNQNGYDSVLRNTGINLARPSYNSNLNLQANINSYDARGGYNPTGEMFRQVPLGQQNYYSNNDKQSDFGRRQIDYNQNIISQSNQVQAREEEARNIDRLNKINSEKLRRQYIDKMDAVRHAQRDLKAAKHSNNIYNFPANAPMAATIPAMRNLATPPIKIEEQMSQPTRMNSGYQRRPTPQMNPQTNYNNPYEQNRMQPLSINPYSMPPPMYSPSFQQQPYGAGYPFPPQVAQGYQPPIAIDQGKKDQMKQVSEVLDKQNQMMVNLMEKINSRQAPQQPVVEPRKNDEVERLAMMFGMMNRMQPPPAPPAYPPHQNNNNNNPLVQMMLQQQMMQVLMHNQALQNQNQIKKQEREVSPKQLSAVELMLKREREERLENAIKQLILQKGGNLEELQKKIDDLYGIKPVVQQVLPSALKNPDEAKPNPKKVRYQDEDEDEEDDDDYDDEEDDEDDNDDSNEKEKAQKEAERKRKVYLSALAKVKKITHRNMFAFLFLKQLKAREDERYKEVQASIKFVLAMQKKKGHEWAVTACDKAFAFMREKPKESLEFIKNIEKIKPNIIEQRINSICAMAQALLDGILESLPSAPGDIFKYNAVYYQEKSYLPIGMVSQFEIDRLEFNQTFGYLVKVKNEQKLMLSGIQFFYQIIILIVLAKPWDYQLAEKRINNDAITQQKIIAIASIIYHIFFDYLKKAVQPIQNNVAQIPDGKKPVPMANTQIYELGGKDQPEKGTRYNLITGMLDYNSLQVVWTQKAEWKNQMQEKIKTITQIIVDKGSVIFEEANELERLDIIKEAQDRQLLLPIQIRKTDFETRFVE